MAQLVTVSPVCDRHAKLGGKDVPGETFTIGINGVWYALEMCKKDRAREIDPIQALVEELGRQIEGNATNQKRLLKLANSEVAGEVASVTTLPTGPRPSAQPAQVATSNGSRSVGRPRSGTATPHWCLWGCPDARYTSSTALLNHVAHKHGVKETMEGLFGLVCPLCGSDGSPKLGMHVSKRHQGLTVCEAFAKAMATTPPDKHGIATPVMEKVPRVA